VRKVWKPAVTDGWEWALPICESDNLTIVESFGKALGSIWTPIRMKVVREDERGLRWKEADMPWMGEHLLILKPRAVSALCELCLEVGELLPLECDDADLVAWNVTTVVDALDQEESKVMRFPSGRILSIKEYHFKSNLVEGLAAFRIPDVRTSIFVGPRFVQRARDAGLTGTRFKELWPIK
jgi:hypothetical protein